MNVISTISLKQTERVTAAHLKSLHDEMTTDFYICSDEGILTIEEQCSLIGNIVAIETILKVLLKEKEYLDWKTVAGLDSSY